MSSDAYHSPQAIIDFATRYDDALNRVVRNRMRQLGIPDDLIGIKGWFGIDEGPFVRFPSTQIGGNINPYLFPGFSAGIALDHGILDPNHPKMLGVPSWRGASLRDRTDAAIAHEYEEALLVLPPGLKAVAAANWLHNQAIRQAPRTLLPITKKARKILQDYSAIASVP